ncbi:hypothetical protein EDD85DRAFT_835204 [Armillaria nabsnona]|nr:hypothetical protein EDD85DRAFT_835204 [Armillaria nabsnona]
MRKTDAGCFLVTFTIPLLRAGSMKINVSTLCRQRKTQHILQILVFSFTVVAILGGMKSNPVYVTVFGILAALVGLLAVLLGQVKHSKEGIDEGDFTKLRSPVDLRSLPKATSSSLVARGPTNVRGRVGKRAQRSPSRDRSVARTYRAEKVAHILRNRRDFHSYETGISRQVKAVIDQEEFSSLSGVQRALAKRKVKVMKKNSRMELLIRRRKMNRRIVF